MRGIVRTPFNGRARPARPVIMIRDGRAGLVTGGGRRGGAGAACGAKRTRQAEPQRISSAILQICSTFSQRRD